MGSCRPMMDHKPTLEFIGSLGRLEEVLNTLIHPANEAILQWCGHRGACQDGLGDTKTPENKSEDFELLRASRYRVLPSLRDTLHKGQGRRISRNHSLPRIRDKNKGHYIKADCCRNSKCYYDHKKMILMMLSIAHRKTIHKSVVCSRQIQVMHSLYSICIILESIPHWVQASWEP